MLINIPPNQKSVSKSEHVLNIHLDVFHLHFIQLLCLLLWRVSICKFLPLHGESHILPILMGGGWQCAVRDLGVMALIGKVTEPLLLRPTASVLSTTHSTAQIDNEIDTETVLFPSGISYFCISQLQFRMTYVPVDQDTLLHQVWMCNLHSSSLLSPSSSPSAHWGVVWLCAEDPAVNKIRNLLYVLSWIYYKKKRKKCFWDNKRNSHNHLEALYCY